MDHEFHNIVETICDTDLRYDIHAYEFVMEALSYTQRKLKRDKHITGPELLKGIRDLLLKDYGPMAMTLLRHWGIKSTEDFGNIVFNLVQNKILSKSEDDNIEHFRNVFDFEEVFDKGYRRQLARRVSRMRSF
jgi:uncharacterized repeat protein (TIGR04138 family)